MNRPKHCIKMNERFDHNGVILRAILFLTGVMFLNGCASAKKCPDVSEEAVSICRAQIACKPSAASAFFGGFSAGFNHTSNQSENNYNACLDRNLVAQKANAGNAMFVKHELVLPPASPYSQTTE